MGKYDHKEMYPPRGEKGICMEKNSKCIVSFESKSKVYHKPGCHHISRIKKRNQIEMTKGEAERAGFRICRCCNGMGHHKRAEKHVLEHYEKEKGMEFKYIDGILYAKTDFGCWKMVYVRGEQRIVLYHRNHTDKELNFEEPQYEFYHRQHDVPHSGSISHYLKYIYEHDRFKKAERSGNGFTTFSNKKNKKLAEKSRKKDSRRRVDYLFRMLESQNVGYRELSYC